ncbi:hypothetical protein MPSEU_000341800 [Mayamaea pseudoterrestris]|nr:hypothetical protein MPSEU_000341800 [Mayamaea pseudoterrestris]
MTRPRCFRTTIGVIITFIFCKCCLVTSFLTETSTRPIHKLQPTLFRSLLKATSATTANTPLATSSTFDWEHQWYPVAPVRDLETNRPNRVTLLGRDFCLWYSKDDGTTGKWQAFADACPHRLVPLSEGRIENNLLQCAYHGWEFDESGSCVRIPQIGASLRESQSSPALASPRACATSFPVCVTQDLVWIFPSTTNQELALQKQPAIIQELDDDRNLDATSLYTRDLPYSWDVLVENLCDPSHVSFSHHGFMNGANRYNENQALDLTVTTERVDGFEATRDGVSADEYMVRFQAPCLLYYSISRNSRIGKSYIGIGSYCVPTAPGKCRLIARFPFRVPVAPVMLMLRNTPSWITHLSQNVILDSDVVFLASQDERLHRRDKDKDALTSPSYYMPSRADTLVRAFRKWLVTAGGGGPLWLGIPAARSGGASTSWNRVPARSGRDELLDRYRQHTEICSSCRSAHRNLYRLQEVCKYSSICLFAWASLLRRKGPMIAALLLFIAPRLILEPLIKRLECVPWPRKSWLQSKLPKDKALSEKEND